MLILCLIFFEEMPFCIPTSDAREFQFLHILANICYFLFFCFLNDDGLPHECEGSLYLDKHLDKTLFL